MTGHISVNYNLAEDWKEAMDFLYDIRYIILFYVFGDFLSTYWALNYGFEQNGFLAAAMEEFGVGILLVLKMCFITIVYWTYKQFKQSDMKFKDTIWKYARNAIAFMGVFLVANNMMVVVAKISLTDLFTLAMM